MNDLTVLMTGCGSEGARGAIRSLRGNGERPVRIIGIDTDPNIANRYIVDAFHVPPHRDAPEFMPFCLDLAAQKGAHIVYPIPTAEIEMFAAAREKFETQGQRVIVSTPEALRVANNKTLLYRHVAEMGLPCAPVHRVVGTWEEFRSAVTDLGYPGERVCFKPAKGTGAVGFRILDARIDPLDLLLHTFPNAVLTRLQEVEPVLRSGSRFPELIVMEHLPGKEYDIDVLALDGHVHALVPRRNEAMWYGMSLICTTEPQEELAEASRRIVESLGLSYVVSLSFKSDAEGRFRLIEINPRIPGSIIATVRAGVNMPYLAVKLALHETVEIPDIRWGTRMVRYWDETFPPPADDARV